MKAATTTRIIPHSIDAEKSVLGSIILDNSCLKKVSEVVDGLDFYLESHREIYRAMLALNLQHKAIDLVTLAQGLKEAGTLESVGGGSYLAELYDFTPTSSNVGHYCRILKENTVSRQLLEFSGKLSAKVMAGGDVGRISQAARERLVEICGGLDGVNGVSAADIVPFDKRQESYEEYVKSIGHRRFKTGFGILDKQIRGVAPGEVMVIIAYSGTFKTAFLQNMLLHGVEATGFHHLFISLEMPIAKIFEREMQIQGGVSGWDVERHFSGNRESEGVMAGLKRQGSRGLLVCDRPRLTLDKIGRYIEIARQKYGELGAVGVDYLGLVHSPGKSLFEKTAYVSIETKNMAKELNVPIIILCQVNRASVAGGEIETHSAKGGGDVEAAADFMLGFQHEAGGELTCKILKNRNGVAGEKFLVDIDRNALQFKDMTAYKQVNGKGRKDIPF